LSAFLGAVQLGRGEVEINPASLPDQPRLGIPRLWTGAGALLVHRQRVNTPEDRFEVQPTPAWGGLGAILFDGRLDDRAGLCGLLGITARPSLPDSELVARAFEKWDEEAASRLMGDFVIAAWDGRCRRAILCADRSGLRPLYFHHADGLLLFSTVLPALLSIPGVPCALDEPVVADLLFNNHRDSRRSFFRGIQRVLRGTTVTLSSSGEKVIEYWRPAPRRPLILGSDEEYVEAAREVLDRAVASRLRSVSPVPLQASGGLDSSCIAVSVLGQTDEPVIPVYTAVPDSRIPVTSRPGHYTSERSAVLALQKVFPRLSPQFIEPAARPDVEFAPETLFEVAAVPLASVVSNGWADMTFQHMREAGATSCFAGHAGNATLTWDGRPLLASLFREGRWVRMAAEAAALAGYRPVRTARSLLSAALAPYIPPAFRQNLWRKQVSLHPRAEAELNMAQRLRASGDRRYIVPRNGTEQRVEMLTVRRALAGEVLAWSRARHGIETRDPLDDVRVIEFCMSVPEEQFLRRGQTRWLARRLLRSAGVPTEITENTSRGAWCPEWFAHLEKRRPGFDLEIARLRESPTACRLLDLDRLSHLAANWPQNPADVALRRSELEAMFTRALHVGAFIRWAEARSAHRYPSRAITSA
jgi:asparagine synthase (glutamine-hydrolysing)